MGRVTQGRKEPLVSVCYPAYLLDLLLDVDLCRPEIHSSSFFKSSGCFVKSFSKSSFASSAENAVSSLLFTVVAHYMHTKNLEW